MPAKIYDVAKFGDAAGDAGRGFVVHDHDGLYRVRRIGGEASVEIFRLSAAAPVAGDVVHVEPHFFGNALPDHRKVSGFEDQHAVAGRKRIDQSRFAGPGARGRENDHRTRGLEDALYSRQDFQSQRGEFGAAMVNDRLVHGAEDAVRDICGAGNLQEVTTAVNHIHPVLNQFAALVRRGMQ